MLIAAYFAGIEQTLERHPQITSLDVLLAQASGDYNGLLRVRAHFWDASYLDVYEVISTELGYPIRLHYAYTTMRQGRHIFRYDNAPHHPELITHPHHRHAGSEEQVAPSEQPSLNRVLGEATANLGS